MKQNNSKQAYENYMAAAYSPENIAKAGGKEAHAAIMKKFKRHERHLMYKRILRDIPFNLICYIIPAVVISVLYNFLIGKVNFLANIPLSLILVIGFILFSIKSEIGYQKYRNK